MGILEASLKNGDTLCSAPRITVNLGQYNFNSLTARCTLEAQSNITISGHFFAESISFVLFKN